MGYSSGSRRSLTSAPSTGAAADQGRYGYGGGNKKQGMPKGIGHYYDVISAIKTRAEGSPTSRHMVFSVNMLGGVGRGVSQFGSPGLSKPDGVRRFAPYFFWSRFP